MLIDNTVQFLWQGQELLENITDQHYIFLHHKGQSSVGSHIRHIIEHYQCLLKFPEETRINYDARKREEKIETSRQKAILQLSEIQNLIKNVSLDTQNTTLHIQIQSGILDLCWSESNLKREYLFLLSHTVHHYAIIRMILEQQDFPIPEHFGFASSTLKYFSDVHN